MDFREKHCIWCDFRHADIQTCSGCPVYLKHVTAELTDIDAGTLCGACANNRDPGLEIFCRTNRIFQQDLNETFECYKYRYRRSAAGENS